MASKFSLWTFLTTALCLVAPSVGEIQQHSVDHHSPLLTGEDNKESHPFVLLPRLLAMARREFSPSPDHQKLLRLLKLLDRGGPGQQQQHQQRKRKFPEIDSRGFDEDIFDEGFGDWSPMKRW